MNNKLTQTSIDFHNAVMAQLLENSSGFNQTASKQGKIEGNNTEID